MMAMISPLSGAPEQQDLTPFGENQEPGSRQECSQQVFPAMFVFPPITLVSKTPSNTSCWKSAILRFCNILGFPLSMFLTFYL